MACARAVRLKLYRLQSVKSMLKSGLDRQPLPELLMMASPVTHENLRGPGYYAASQPTRCAKHVIADLSTNRPLTASIQEVYRFAAGLSGWPRRQFFEKNTCPYYCRRTCHISFHSLWFRCFNEETGTLQR